MKKFLLATVALVALGAAVPALAADLGARTYSKAPAFVPAPIYNWTGFYIGGHIGGAFRDTNNNVLLGNNNNNDGRFIGGGQVGYDYQFAQSWVAGIEANYSFVDTRSNIFFDNRGLGSVTGRLGYTWGPTLLYAKGGYAWADTRRAFGFNGTNGRDGYTVGGGLEYLFAQNWSAKVEYQYYDFGNVNVIAPIAGRFRDDEHTIKVGVNYRFNWANPIVAKY